MNATSTHDTKRGEDVRLRISALSEMSDAWATTVRGWRERNARHRANVGPDPNDEYLVYQTLIGGWPIERDRLDAYVEKALREAKVHTTWASPNAAYEGAVRDFVHGILADERFCAELEALLPSIVRAGRFSSLSQLLIKVTAPGVPDLYQGTELWDMSLVDPDNRRPVDYDSRRELLAFAQSAGPAAVLERMDEGAPKLWLLRRALRVRADRRRSFEPGAGYRPLEARGVRAANVISFVRGDGVLTVAPRLFFGLGDPPDWGDTVLPLPAGKWRDVLGRSTAAEGDVPLAALLRDFPVALLLRDGA
jgi:(1->4)-alpha-D-glucan 1-alpha-D-glucosylmutase